MALFARFHEMPINSIRPQGWIRKYLENQRDGLTGHLEAAGFPFDRNPWEMRNTVQERKGADWWPYEQAGYWVDGMIRCGYLLQDSFLIEKARKSIDAVLSRQSDDGFLGPEHLRSSDTINRWALNVFFRALMAEFSATGDRKIPEALKRHYLNDDRSYTHDREICNIEPMLWAAEQCGSKELVGRALQAFKAFEDDHNSLDALLSDRIPAGHGVTFNEMAKLGAIIYMNTEDRDALRGSVNAYAKLEKYHMLVDGVCSSSEHVCGNETLDSHETCVIADQTWSLGYLFAATGKVAYADLIEKACFNAAPGAVRTYDMKAIQYFSCPNQFLATSNSDHNDFRRGGAAMSYGPNRFTECCPGQFNRIMPDYACRMWMTRPPDGIAAVLYGPSRIDARVGTDQVPATIFQETDYPFGEQIDFRFEMPSHARFTLNLRIPGWCDSAEIEINGEKSDIKAVPGAFATLEREWRNDDRVRLRLPMKIRLSHWDTYAVAVERGPLVFALGIEEDWRVVPDERSTSEFPAYDLLPASPWNYALDMDEDSIDDAGVEFSPMSPNPWTLESAPVRIKVPVRRVEGWSLLESEDVSYGYPWKDRKRRRGVAVMTPPLPPSDEIAGRLGRAREFVSLVPYGCTHLRLTLFPSARLKPRKWRSVKQDLVELMAQKTKAARQGKAAAAPKID